jgi:hypothetical protein
MTPRELAFWWLNRTGKNNTSEKEIKRIISKIIELKNRGYKSTEIISLWEKYIQDNGLTNISSIDQVIPKNDTENLIDKNKNYLHPRLNRLPNCVRSVMDENGNVHHTIDTDWKPETISNFTPDDLLAYYRSKFPNARINENRDKGALKYLAGKYGIDQLLFIIDASSMIIHTEDIRQPKSPFEITDYYEEGIFAYEDKRNHV